MADLRCVGVRLLFAACFGLGVFASKSAMAEEVIPGLTAEAAWVRTPPPGARMLAGYVELHNQGDQAVELVGAEADDFAMVEIHQSYREDGRMRMREVNPLVIEAGDTAVLAPGGLHLMLMRPTRQLVDGEQVDIRLINAQGQRLKVVFNVQRSADEA